MNDDLNSQIENLKKSDELLIRKQSKQQTPPYSIIGNGKTSKKYSNDVVDTLKVYGELNKTQQDIFLYFRDEVLEKQLKNHWNKVVDPNPNEVILNKSTQDFLTQEIKKKLRNNNNGKTLVEKNILKKKRAGQYMLNPFMLIPPHDFERVSALWKSYDV